MNIYQPYTYLIGWTEQDKWYYGVRYAKNCSPADLWVKYFTSSSYVHEFREQNGEPDVIQVRKIFGDHTSAVLWEEKVLRKIDANNNNKFLNANIAGAIDFNDIVRKKMSDAKKGKGIGKDNNNYGNYWTDEQKQNLSKKRKESGIAAGKNNPMYGRKRSDTTERNKLPKQWVTNGVEDKLILREKLDDYLSNGYIVGRSKSNNRGSKIKYSTVCCEICRRNIRPVNYPRHLKKCSVLLSLCSSRL